MSIAAEIAEHEIAVLAEQAVANRARYQHLVLKGNRSREEITMIDKGAAERPQIDSATSNMIRFTGNLLEDWPLL